MGTIAVEQALVLSIPVEVLAPGSEYDQRRMALKSEYDQIILAAQKIGKDEGGKEEIRTAEEAQQATDLGRLLQAGTKESGIFFSPIKRQIDAFKGPVLQHQNEFEESLETEKKRLGRLLTTYNDRVERERIAAERKAREEAEEQARNALLDRAVELDVSGDHEAAVQILEEPVFVPLAVQRSSPLKTKGQVGKTSYKCIVTNFMELVKAVADGKAPIQALSVNQSFLDNQARQYQEQFSMPGCKRDRNNGTHFRA